MTKFQERLIILLDEWLGIVLLAWLRYREDSLFWPVLVAWSIMVYVISYVPFWLRWK